MAIPTIASITPAIGPCMGRAMVDIVGTNFNVPTTPVTGNTNGASIPAVEVLFDGIVSAQVQVLSDTRLTALTPIHAEATVDIIVRNLDTNGDPVPTETVTAAAAYTFTIPQLTQESPSDLQRIIRTFIEQLELQLGVDVSLTVHTDYSEETGAILHTVELSEFPGLVLRGPDLKENRFYSVNARPEFDEGTIDDDFVTTAVPYTVDLIFEVFGFSDSMLELVNLVAATTLFFHKNKDLAMDRDPADVAKGTVSYEMDFAADGEFKISNTKLSDSNVRSFNGTIVIRGFDIEGLQGISSGKVGDVPANEAIQRSREGDDSEVALDPMEQTGVSSGPGGPTIQSGPVVRSIKSPGDC